MKCPWCEYEGEPGDVALHWRFAYRLTDAQIGRFMEERGYIDGWNDAEKKRQASMDSRQSKATK